jgi:hypothetical protein
VVGKYTQDFMVIFPLVSGVFLHLLHSFRVYFYIFSTRFECSPRPPSSEFDSPFIDEIISKLTDPSGSFMLIAKLEVKNTLETS